MCHKAIDDFLPALIFVSDWFIIRTMIENLPTASYTNDNLLYFNEDSGDAIFSWNEMGILSIDPNNINLDNPTPDEDDELFLWYGWPTKGV